MKDFIVFFKPIKVDPFISLSMLELRHKALTNITNVIRFCIIMLSDCRYPK